MAKTLIYAAGSPTSVKLGDTDTDLYLQVAKDNVAIDLTAVKSITVKIADANKNYLKDISIAPSSLTSGNNGILTVPLNSDNIGGLNSGDYYFEVWIVTADSETEIYPDMNVTKFHVFNNLVGGTTILTTLTMQAFLDRITANQNASETSLSNSQTALANANTANANAAKALSDLTAGNYLTKDTLSSAPGFETLQTQVNNSAVGTNLLTGTSNDIVSVTADEYGSGHIYKFSNLAVASALTGRMWINDAPYDCFAEIIVCDSSGNILRYIHGGTVLAGSSGFSSATFSPADGESYIYFEIGYTTMQTSGATLQYAQAKLQKGSVANDYSLNPAEILTQSDYAKIKAAIVALGGSLS